MIKHTIIERLGEISQSEEYSKQVNLVSWNDRIPVIDVRSWRGDKPLKGITLSREEAATLVAILEKAK